MEKFTLITGASSGLGKELAMLYAQDNNNLLLVATNENKLINVVKQIKESNSNIKIEYLIADLSKQEDRQKVYNSTKEKLSLLLNLPHEHL